MNSDLSSITQPSGWMQISHTPHIVLCNTIYTSISSAAVKYTITVFDDLSWNCQYYEKVINIKSCLRKLAVLIPS